MAVVVVVVEVAMIGGGGSSSSRGGGGSSSSSQRNNLATGWRNRGSNPDRGKRMTLGPNQPSIQVIQGLFPAAKSVGE